jgi:hypothetical protein
MDWNHDGKIDARDSVLYHCCIKSSELPKTSVKPPTVGRKTTYKTTNYQPKQKQLSGLGWGIIFVLSLVCALLK